jgi:hypothetical protein
MQMVMVAEEKVKRIRMKEETEKREENGKSSNAKFVPLLNLASRHEESMGRGGIGEGGKVVIMVL